MRKTLIDNQICDGKRIVSPLCDSGSDCGSLTVITLHEIGRLKPLPFRYMQQSNGNGLTAYLQTDSEVKDILKASESITPAVQSYGGDEIPRAVVMVQQYAVTKKQTEKTGIYRKKMEVKKDENGNPIMQEVGEVNGVMNYKPELIESGKWREVRTTTGEEVQNTLSVIPLRAKVDKNTLNHVLGCNFNELQTSILQGKPIERKTVVNGIERTYRLNVKTAIRKGAIIHLFVREGNKVLSTVQVNGGIKGGELLSDLHKGFQNLYEQIKAAQEAEKPAQVSAAICTALGMKIKS